MYLCSMKKRMIIGILFCTILCISTSCARKVIGATPHRRDRNCGCENLQSTPMGYDLAVRCDEMMNYDEAMK